MASAVEMTQMHDVHLAPKPGTQADAQDMRRMGKLQELNVSNNWMHGKIYHRTADHCQASLHLHDTRWICGDCGFGMAVCSCVGHELAVLIHRIHPIANHSNSTGALALTNGGAAGAVWVFLAVAVGMFSVVVSMAEMASM